MFTDNYFARLNLPDDVRAALSRCRVLAYAETHEELEEMVYGPTRTSRYDVQYMIEGRMNKEVEVVRCKNGCAANFMEDYMRRRDPNTMTIGDDLPTDKPRFRDRFGYEFSQLRAETLDWLSQQMILLLPFTAGDRVHGSPSLLVCPINATFFALGLANMQGFVSIRDIPENYTPRSIIYVAPPFRQTHFNGKQIVVHNRSKTLHEVFSYNLYPGPSAKKGVFSILLDIGEQEGWICCHASAAMLETPYENEVVFMHEGASGGGKSEMDFHREEENRVLIGTSTETGEKYYLTIRESCKIYPIADDMACAYKGIQDPESGKLTIVDAEDGWFLRMDGDNAYGDNPAYEKVSIHPPKPLSFFNIEGTAGATALIWEHTIESNGKPNQLQPPRDHSPQYDRQYHSRRPPHAGRRALFRGTDAAVFRLESQLRGHGDVAGDSPFSGVGMASGFAARLQQSEHRGDRRGQRPESGGCGLLLALRDG